MPSVEDRKVEQNLQEFKKAKQEMPKLRKIQYRLNSELFVLYDHYQPVRILSANSQSVIWYVINVLFCVPRHASSICIGL